ncbi:MAG: STELLO glycosyltransferase family protein [Coriobacteriia bacterium]|nr:STELLO glycosyltransferase family protein [Coriobacteriia bacterium]
MSGQRLTCVLTTIQAPTESVRALAATLERSGADLLVIGDRKGPVRSQFDSGELIAIDEQGALPFELASLLPENHYTRKNLGYLLAVSRGAATIYETDDDNMPLPAWEPRSLTVDAVPIAPRPWANVYRFFSPESMIWPRGFPLGMANDPTTFSHEATLPAREVEAPIQQGLANGSPDVDAVWRLLLDREHTFGDPGTSLWLPPGTWCPFNSQSTWWWPVAYPLMYLPSFCTFRMTDIWRGFVAQRCLWELDRGLVFHPAEVVQDRNQHDLLRDLRDEMPGYLGNERLCAELEAVTLGRGPAAVSRNLQRCYEALVEAGFLPADELLLVDAWIHDIASCLGGREGSL